MRSFELKPSGKLHGRLINPKERLSGTEGPIDFCEFSIFQFRYVKINYEIMFNIR